MRSPRFQSLLEGYQAGRVSRRSFIQGALALGVSVQAASLIASGTVSAQENGENGEPSGELVIALPRSLIALDPHGAQSVEESTAVISSHIFDTLVVRDPDTGELLPRLATSWEATDETTWVFNLREGVTFHDGSEFTSEDVRASLERVLEEAGPLAPLWALVESIETPDPLTVEINTSEPLGTVPVSASLLFIAPAGQMDEPGFFNEPVGMGSFRFVSWVPDAELVLEANPDFWDGPPSLERLVFRDIPETSARVTALETGEIDFTFALPADQLPPLLDNPDLTTDTTPTFAYYFNWFNSSREPFTDARVRQAMAYALDVDTMVEDLLQGVGTRAQAPIPSTVFGFAPQEPYEYDPERAMALLEEAGFPDGFETTLQWNPGSGPQDRELVLTMISNWAAIGVQVENLEKERAQWLDDLIALNWDMNFQTNTVRTGDADFTLRRLYVAEANRNGYANDELDEVLIGAAAALDPAEREELYAEACRIIWDEAVGIFPFDLLENYIYQDGIEGFVPQPSVVPTFERVTVNR